MNFSEVKGNTSDFDKFQTLYNFFRSIVEKRGGCGVCISCQSVLSSWMPIPSEEYGTNAFCHLMCDKWYENCEDFPGSKPDH